MTTWERQPEGRVAAWLLAMARESEREICAIPRLGDTTGLATGGFWSHVACWLGLVAQWLLGLFLVVTFWLCVCGLILSPAIAYYAFHMCTPWFA